MEHFSCQQFSSSARPGKNPELISEFFVCRVFILCLFICSCHLWDIQVLFSVEQQCWLMLMLSEQDFLRT